MKTIIFPLMMACLLTFGAMHPAASYAGGPNLMVFGDDADEDAVPRDSRVFKRVINALRSQMSDEGFDVYDEVAVTVKETDDGEGGYAQGRVRRTDAEILDIAQSLKSPPIDVVVMFQIYASANDKGYTTKVRARISGHILTVQTGQYLGDFEVKQMFNAPANCNRECILESVGDHARRLAEELGDVLTIKLAHLVNEDSGRVAGRDGGIQKGYNLIFSNFTADERLDIEEYLVIFSGYEHYRPVDCSRLYCEYWYQSSISSAKLNRNILRMIDQLGIQANIRFSGNTMRVDKITLRNERPAKPRGGEW